MDFGSLTRRELQSLCKLNKIPANITNVAMANALKSLEIVEGIEEFLKTSKSETSDIIESTEKVEAPSPKVPQTSCRTTTRQKLTKTEAENLPPTATRTTRRGTRQLAGAADESKTDMLKTPAVSGSRRKALATSSCRNVSNQLNECEEEVVAQSRRNRETAKKEERTVLRAYSTRRSTRLTEKKSTEPRVRKESAEAVKIDSFLDEMIVASQEESGESVEVLEDIVVSENPSAEVEDICKAFEKLDVLVVEESSHNIMLDKPVNVEEATLETGNENEEEDDAAINNPNLKSHEISNPCEDVYVKEKLNVEEAPLKGEIKIINTESDEIKNPNTESEEALNPCEDVYVEEKMNLEEAPLEDAIKNQNTESDEIKNPNSESEEILTSCEDVYVEEKMNAEEAPLEAEIKILNTESEEALNLCEDASSEVEYLKPESDSISSPCEDDDSEEEKFDFSEEAISEHSDISISMVHEDTKNQIPESDGSPSIVCNSKNISAVQEVSENMVDSTTTMAGEVEDVTESNANEEKSQVEAASFSAPYHPTRATPMKKSLMIVSDNKENNNIEIVKIMDEEENKKKKEEIENMSMRQLRKQLKALTIKKTSLINHANANNTKEVKTRMPLQALCDNQPAAAGQVVNNNNDNN